MSREKIAHLIRRINTIDTSKGVLYVAGGGTEIFPMLLSQGGGSSTLLAGRIPYDPQDFRATLGYDPGRLVDARVARGLAMVAFRHALSIRGDLTPDRVFGIGSTSKLARIESDREGRLHEIHVALQTSSRTVVRSIPLPLEHGRGWQERINALILLELIAMAKGLDSSFELAHEGISLPESLISERSAGLESSGLGQVLIGNRPWVALELDRGRVAITTTVTPRLLLPGSFRPLHGGHVAMAEAAARMVGVPCDYEISLFHPDKPPLDYLAIRSRIEGFGNRRACLYLTNAPTFLEKVRLFPGCKFAVGHDTMVRILEPRYYNGPAGRDAVLDELEKLGATFLVFGRIDASGRFVDFNPEAFDHPAVGFLERFARPVPEHIFRSDVSSTKIRSESSEIFD